MITLERPPAPPAPPAADPAAARAGERARRRRRRRLLGWSALPALASLALWGVLLGRAVANERGIDAVEHSTFARARALDAVEWFDRAGWVELTDRELAPFNRGVAWFLGRRARPVPPGVRGPRLRTAGEDTRCLARRQPGPDRRGSGRHDDRPQPGRRPGAVRRGQGHRPEQPAMPAPARRPTATARATGWPDCSSGWPRRCSARRARRSPAASRTRAAARDPDDDFSELEQQLDENAETRSEGRELEEEVVLDPSVFDGPQW